ISGLQDVTVVQATGVTSATFAYTPELCSAAFADAVDARLINIAAPSIVSAPDVRNILFREPLIESQFEALIEVCSPTA
ncbi:hypothetical protein ACCS66_38675, partial [Rhizobium ruizarguesonis]